MMLLLAVLLSQSPEAPGVADPPDAGEKPPEQTVQTPAPGAEPAATEAAPAPIQLEPVSNRRLHLALGFSHWFGETLGTPLGITTPVIELAARPGLSWLEIHLRYALSGPLLPVGAGVARVGFISLGVMLDKEFHFNRQSIELFVGPEGVLIHAGSAGGGIGLCVGARWLFQIPVRLPHYVGPYIETRGLFYLLPGDMRDFFSNARRDAQIDLGVVATLF